MFLKIFLKIWKVLKDSFKKVLILFKLFVDPSPSPLKFGSKNRYKSPETIPKMFLNTPKISVWILGLTPPTPLDKFHTCVLFL